MSLILMKGVIRNGRVEVAEPINLPDGSEVTITGHAWEKNENWVQESYGLCGWKGNAEELRRLALAPDLDLEDEP
jgi:hypothetical protein